MRELRKRIVCMGLVLCLCLVMLLTVVKKAEAATPGYTVSAEYKGSAYYSALCNVTLTGNQRTDIVNVALSQVGYREGSYSGDYGGADDGSYNNYTEFNYWYHNNVNSGMPVGGESAPWCATFVSWCAEQANISPSVLRRSTAAGHGASYFDVNFYSGSSTLASSSDNDSYFKGYNYTPQKGDLFFTRSWSHVGLVVGVSGNYVITVEGNTNNNGSSQGNGVYKLTWRKITDLYFGVPNYANSQIKHTVDTSYGTNFTAYPKAKITAENIIDAYHSQIDSTSWIGTSDMCTIHEVYTDGCCKVTYPLDAGGTKTVYSKISLFNTHTHSYTGARIYENAHPHRISQRCVDYATCGGWIWTDEYYELKTCEQCWHADFEIGASAISVKVGESKTVSATVSGCLPDSAVLYRSFSPDNDVVEVTIKNQQATFTGQKAGSTDFSLTVYSDSSKSLVIGTITIPVTVTTQTYCESNGHSYSFKASKIPTTSAAGTLTGTCSKCSVTTSVNLPKLNITDYTYKVIKEPSYTATGTGRYTWNTTKYGTFYFDVTLDKLADSIAPKIVLENVTATAGETVSVSVYLENNPGVAYAKFKVDYSDELTLVSAENQSVLSGTFTTSKTVGVKPYVLQWMGADNSTENGCFVILTFQIAEDAEDGIYDITMTCSEAYDAAYEDVTFAITNASVTVTSYIPGDVNGDGKVNGKDGVLLAQYLAEWDVTINMDAADVNGDGKVNGKDGVLLAQYLAEWDVTLG